MKNVVTYTPPKMRPLPGTITDVAVREATLPVKIEAARRAIQQCEDLPELLRYQDQAEGLAAAVRIMKHVAPEMVRSANEMVADAWRKGGELLSQYSNVSSTTMKDPKAGIKGGIARHISPRRVAAEAVGIGVKEATSLVRVFKAPARSVSEALEVSQSLQKVAAAVPNTRDGRGKCHSDAMRSIFRGGLGTSGGLNNVKSMCTSILSKGGFAQLTPDERKVVKAKITEIMELLDEMDRLCK